jgi:hypothetical protein
MKGYKHLTDEQRQQILDLYQKTKSTKLAAQKMNLSVRRVAYVVSQAGIELTNSHGGTCYHHQAEIEQWAKEGVSLSEMARRIGTKHQLVKKFLVQHGIEHKPYRQAMENNTFWRGGRIVDIDGYVLIKTPDHPHKDRHGYVREHRLVVEQLLGRYLLPTEVVHHIDGNKQNNVPENLEVFGSNAEHLAETLKGRVPQWSKSGKARISEAVSQANKQRDKSSFYRLVTNGSESRYIFVPKQALDDKGQLRPS